MASIRRPRTTDDSDTDFQPVNNNKSLRKQRRSRETHVSHGVTSDCSAINGTSVQNASNQNGVIHIGVADNQLNSLLHALSVSHESKRYALTRYPFSPFIIRFNSGKISVNQVKECLLNHWTTVHQTNVQILNCRSCNPIVGINHHYDILIYIKDPISFSFLLDQTHWPNTIGNESFSLLPTPSIPPPLCLLIQNVDLNIDFNDFCGDLNKNFPSIKNIIHMKNKFQNDIKMIKLEFTSPVVRDKLLLEKRIVVNYLTYDIMECLAPVNVLICSKCMGIGHFKKQCSQIKETCRTCGDQVDDLKNHECSKVERCIHCNQSHKSNSLKCPVIKSFRAELTRKILHSDAQATPMAPTTNQGFTFLSSHFPPLPASKSSTSSTSSNNVILNKLDELIGKISGVKDQLTNLEAKHDKFEQFMTLKNQSDENIKADPMSLSSDHVCLKKDVVQHGLSIEYQGNLLHNIFLPMIEDMCLLIYSLNVGDKGKTINADLQSKLDRYHAQLKKAKEGNHSIN